MMTALNAILALSLLVVSSLGPMSMAAPEAQRKYSVKDLSELRSSLDQKALTVRGVLVSGHAGVLLKDDKEDVAIRLRFDDLPPSARGQVQVKDELYRRLFDLANSLPAPDQPKRKYGVEMQCFVTVSKKQSLDLYRESPIEIYLLRVLRVEQLDPAGKP